jgi:hypothetical protein
MHREVQPIVVFDRISNIAHGKFMRITSPSLHRGANAGAFFRTGKFRRTPSTADCMRYEIHQSHINY